MIPSLLYVSHRTQPPAETAAEFHKMLDLARERNEVLEVTGALVSTEKHFAQYLEGPAEALKALMTSIRKDPMHHRLATFVLEPVSTRRFWEWSLAAQEASAYLAKKVCDLADVDGADEPSADIAALLYLMQALVNDQAALLSREVPDSIWSDRASLFDGDAARVDTIRSVPDTDGSASMIVDGLRPEQANADLAEAVHFMRQALERLDACNASVAAVHLDLAIASAASLLTGNETGTTDRSKGP